MFVATGSQQSGCAARHHVHAGRGHSAAGERRLRSPCALAHVLSLALLRRQALPSPALACRRQQEHNGALQPPDPHGHEGGAHAPGRPRRS